MLSVFENPTDSVTVQSEKLFIYTHCISASALLFSGNAIPVTLPSSYKSGLEVMFVN